VSKRRFYFHLALIGMGLLIGGLSIWESGWMIAGKSYPNFTTLAMIFLVIGQILQIKAGFDEIKKGKNHG